MLTEFKVEKKYKVLTFNELSKLDGVIKDGDESLITDKALYYYEKEMDNLEYREFIADNDSTHETNDNYTIEPWMCAEIN